MNINGSVFAIKVAEEPCLEVSSYWLNGPGGRSNPSNCDSISSLNDSIKSPVDVAKQFCSEELMEKIKQMEQELKQ